LSFCLLKQIIGRLSADADCQMADTDYRPIIGAPLVGITNYGIQHLCFYMLQIHQTSHRRTKMTHDKKQPRRDAREASNIFHQQTHRSFQFSLTQNDA